MIKAKGDNSVPSWKLALHRVKVAKVTKADPNRNATDLL